METNNLSEPLKSVAIALDYWLQLAYFEFKNWISKY